MSSRRIAFVLKGYPRLSETFIAQEIRALEERGLRLLIVSLRHPTDRKRHPLHDEIEAPVLYLPEYLYQEPVRVLRALWRCRKRPGLAMALRVWLRDLVRDRSANRVRRFGQAAVLAAELPADVGRLHAHFLHTPASVTRYAAIMLRAGWSCSAHAKDIWTSPDWEKREKLASCDWCVTCTAANQAHLQALAPRPEQVQLVYHGLDLDRFAPPDRALPKADGCSAAATVTVASVGRAVEKKGYDTLLRALARLPAGLHWRFVHAGGGSGLAGLGRLAQGLGIGDRVTWLGPSSQDEVLSLYRRSHLFALASRTAADGDRDGLPNVLVEAQSQGLACVATRVSAIPELIEDGVNGRLVEPDDVPALAGAISDLIAAPDERRRLGEAGQARVRSRFSLAPGVDALAARFRDDLRDEPIASAGDDGEHPRVLPAGPRA